MQSPKIGIGVFVFKDGKFLVGKRLGSHGDSTWSLPGGHLEFGETPEQTAAREVMEETGLKINNVRLAGVTNDIFKNDDKHYVTLWMLSDWHSGTEDCVEPDKLVELRWSTLETLPKPLFQPCWDNLFASDFIKSIKSTE